VPQGSSDPRVVPGGLRGRTVGELLRAVPLLPPAMSCGAVADLFAAEADAVGFVVDGEAGRYGLVDRATFLPRYLERYNRDLFRAKPIAMLMDHRPLIVDADTPIGQVGLQVTRENQEALKTGFIITRDGAYAGIGVGLDLVRTIALEAQEALSELRDAQASLVQAQTFASLGRLVAGVAHEINTPIGVGLTAASHLHGRTGTFKTLVEENRLKRSDLAGFVAVAEEASAIIMTNIERAAELIRSFKQVAVDQTSAERRRFRLADLIDDTQVSLAPALRKRRLEIAVDCPAGIEMDSYPGPLTQVLTNLILNAAIHAFDEDAAGRLVVTASERPERVEIECRDNGRGIAPVHLARLFEPFFTTRRGQGGTGLGLHVVHNIVTQMLQGTVQCDSEVGVGTRFHISLPRRVIEATAAPPPAAPVAVDEA
jgi:signal transduction histidine kinase